MPNVLIINDTHLRHTNVSTIKNYLKIQDKRMMNLISLIKSNTIDYLIIAGDYSDGGYRNQTYLMSHRNISEEIANSVGCCILLLGNHFWIERDSNLEMYLIQPHNTHKLKDMYYSSKQVFKTTPFIRVDDVQFSIFDYDKNNKLYVQDRLHGVSRHIGIYHDEFVLPSSISADMHIPIHVQSKYLKRIYANIDEAFCAHIHKPFGFQKVVIDGREISIHIPGSMTITEKSEAESHSIVNLPLYKINGNRCSLELIPFDTLYGELEFIEKKDNSSIKEKVNEMMSYELLSSNNNDTKYLGKETLITYLRLKKSRQPKYIEMAEAASAGILTLDTALNIYFKKESILYD